MGWFFSELHHLDIWNDYKKQFVSITDLPALNKFAKTNALRALPTSHECNWLFQKNVKTLDIKLLYKNIN